MFISTFTLGDTNWRIQGWKGNYANMGLGSEIGVYYNKPGTIESGVGHYKAAHGGDMLYMQYDVYNMGSGIDNDLVFRASGTHWWLSGFRPGIGVEPADISLTGSITFQSEDMATAFMGGLGTVDGSFNGIQNGAVVNFTWR